MFNSTNKFTYLVVWKTVASYNTKNNMIHFQKYTDMHYSIYVQMTVPLTLCLRHFPILAQNLVRYMKKKQHD